MERTYTVEYEMTDELAEGTVRAVLSSWRHYLRLFAWYGGGPFFLGLLILLAVLLLFRPQLSPGEGVLMVALLAFAAGLLARQNLHRSLRMGLQLASYGGASRTLHITFADDGVVFEMAGVGGKLAWEGIEVVEVHHDLWLFRLRFQGQFAVPVSVLSPELQGFLRERALVVN
jgi:hypothetical protein